MRITWSELMRWSPWTITPTGRVTFRTDGVWNTVMAFQRRAARLADPVRILVHPEDVATRNGCDVFDDLQGDMALAIREARLRFWRAVNQMPDVTWIVVTRHPENIGDLVPASWLGRAGARGRAVQPQWPKNFWVGCEVDDKTADSRLPVLLSLPAPKHVAQVVFAGDPARAQVPDLSRFLPAPGQPGIGWVLVASRSDGISGCQSELVAHLAGQCGSRGVPTYLLQVGQLQVQGRPWPFAKFDVGNEDPAAWPPELQKMRQFP